MAKLRAESLAGLLAAFSVSPFMFTIDKAVVQKSETGRSLI
jgi:hypothetical protein